MPGFTGREGNGTLLQYSCLEHPMDGGAWCAAVHGVAKSWTWLSGFPFTFYFHALEKEMATHSSVLAWRIPGMGEPGGLLSMGSHRVGHDWRDLAAAAAAGFTGGFPPGSDGKESACQCRRLGFDPWVRKIPWRREWQPLQYSCLENSMDRGVWNATVHGLAESHTIGPLTLSNFHSGFTDIICERKTKQQNNLSFTIIF